MTDKCLCSVKLMGTYFHYGGHAPVSWSLGVAERVPHEGYDCRRLERDSKLDLVARA